MAVNETDYLDLEFETEKQEGRIQLSRHRRFAPLETTIIGTYSPTYKRESFILIQHHQDLLQVTLNQDHFTEEIAQSWKQNGSLGICLHSEVALRNIEIQVPDEEAHDPP